MKYVVAGNATADCITFADGRSTGFVPGGATLFALLGIQLWTDQVLLCGGFGADYKEYLGDWMERNGIDRRGFRIRDPKNPLNYMYYRDEGGWDSRTEYGEEHFQRLDCNPAVDHLEEFLDDTVGVSIFRGNDPEFYRQMFALRKQYGFRLGWEIKGNFAVPEQLETIRKLAQETDSFSINYPETCQLFQVDTEEAAIRALQTLKVPLVIFRVGKKGLYLIQGEQVLFAPSFQKYPVVDVTGCGNSSTSAAFYAWCEGKDLFDIAAYANVTAGHNLRYYGAMELSPETKQAARQDVKEFAAFLRDTQSIRTIKLP